MSGWYDSPAGKIESAWENKDGKIEYRFNIPCGTTAKISLIFKGKTICINGIDFKAEELGKLECGKLIFELTAGNYTIC
jgi:hypothetical protein